MCTVGGLVVSADHFHRLSCLQAVESNINGATAVVARPLSWVGNEHFLVVRRRFPEHFGHIPGPVRIMNEQPVTRLMQLSVNADECLCCRALHEGTCLRVEDGAE